MDARIIVEAIEAKASIGNVAVTAVIVVPDTVEMLVSQDAMILAPLLSRGNHSVSAVAPDFVLT